MVHPHLHSVRFPAYFWPPIPGVIGGECVSPPIPGVIGGECVSPPIPGVIGGECGSPPIPGVIGGKCANVVSSQSGPPLIFGPFYIQMTINQKFPVWSVLKNNKP